MFRWYRASAVSLRDASRKKFVPGRTVVKTEKAQDGLAGFDGAAVQKAPDFLGRIEFDISPSSGLKAEMARSRAMDEAVLDFGGQVGLVADAALLLGGYHQHARGEWRLRHDASKCRDEAG